MANINEENTINNVIKIVNMKLQKFKKNGGIDPYILIRVYEKKKEYLQPKTETYESCKATIGDIHEIIQRDKKELVKKCDGVQTDLKNGNTGKAINRSQTKIDHLNREKNRLLDLTDKIKNVCDGKYDVILDTNNSIDKNIITKQVEIIQFDDNIDIEDYDLLKDKICKLQFALNRFKDTIHRQFDELNKLRDDIIKMREENEKLKNMLNSVNTPLVKKDEIKYRVIKGNTPGDVVLTYEKKYHEIEPNHYGHIIDIKDANKNVKEDQMFWERRHNMWMAIPAKKRRIGNRKVNDDNKDESSSDDDFRSDEEEDIDFEYYYD